METIRIDTTAPGRPFPRLHEGRYEVDPVGNRSYPPFPRLIANARRCGLRLLRVGVGIWLPGQEPDAADLAEREWFNGVTLEDTADPGRYNFAHLDRVIDTCLALGCDAVLSVDYMPRSLAVRRPAPEIPEVFKPFAPGYTYPDGVRTAPPADPEVFAAAALHLVRYVDSRGVHPRHVELWNEPDLPFWWSGSFDEFWAMYRAFARVISAAGYRVGGPSWAAVRAPEDWRDAFIERAATEPVPLDFYSWHRYPRRPEKVLEAAREIREVLDRNGLTATESLIDEWGYDLREPIFWGTTAMAAFMVQCLVGFADLGMTAQLGGLLVDALPPDAAPPTLGLFTRDGDANPVFFTFEALERFQETPLRLPLAGSAAAVAGVDAGGSAFGLIVANAEEEERTYRIDLGGRAARGQFRLLTQGGFDANRDWLPAHPWDSADPGFVLTLPPGSVAAFEATLSAAP